MCVSNWHQGLERYLQNVQFSVKRNIFPTANMIPLIRILDEFLDLYATS